MLNPSQIRSRRFSSTARGTYRSEEVDAFVEEVAASYDQMFQENAELVKRLNQLAERVDEYRKDEDSIRAAILTSQKVADQITREAQQSAQAKAEEADAYYKDIVEKAKSDAAEATESAQRKADGILAEAQMKAQLAEKEARQQSKDMLESAQRESADIIERISRDIRTETITLDMIKKEAATFKEELLAQYKRHIAFIEELPGVVADMTLDEANTRQGAAAESNEELLGEATDESQDFSSGDRLPAIDEAPAQEESDIFAGMKAKAMSELSVDDSPDEAAKIAAEGEEIDITDLPAADESVGRESGAEAVFDTDMYEDAFGEKVVDEEAITEEAVPVFSEDAEGIPAPDQAPAYTAAIVEAQPSNETVVIDEDTSEVIADEDNDINGEDEEDDDEDEEDDDEDEEDEDEDEDDEEDEDEDENEEDEEEDDDEDEDIDEDADAEDNDTFEKGEEDAEDEAGESDDADEENPADDDEGTADENDGETEAAGGFRISLDDFDDDDGEQESKRPSLSDFETVQFDEEEDDEPGGKDGGDSPQSRFRGFFKK